MAGQHAAQFAAQVYACDLPKAQRLHKVVDGIYPHFVRQRVVVSIAGAHDAASHIDCACGMTAKAVVAKEVHAAVMNHSIGTAFSCFECSQGHKGLVGRAWRIGAAQGAVEQGLVDRFIECRPVFLVDAVDKQIGVEGGHAHQCQHLPIARVDSNQCATALAVHIFHQLLQLDIYREHHVLPRCGGHAGELAHNLARGGNFHLLAPRCAVQLRLVALLYAEFANVASAFVVERVFAFFECFFFFLVDAGDVANQVA